MCPPGCHAGASEERFVSVGIQSGSGKDRVVIAIDPHKASWTAAAVDGALRPLAGIRVPVSRDGYRVLRRFARRWPNTGWAIEGATGGQLTRRLRADGIEVIDVPPKLATWVRLLSIGHGRKTDDADGVSVGIAALTSPTLNTAETTALRAIVDHRDDVVKIRTQTVNRLHVVLTHLVPGGAGRNLGADHAAELLRGVRARDAAAKTLCALAMDLISEVRQLDRRIAKAAADIQAAVTASGTTLTAMHGVGTSTAAKILAHVGAISRFRSAATFANYTGTAPIEVSSGEVLRHRLSRAGDRQLNCCLHLMAITQVRQDTPGRANYLRKRREGKSHNEAMRCLKRRLSDLVYRRLIHDADTQKAGPGGHSGAALSSRAAGEHPEHRHFRQVTSRARPPKLQPPP
jgi:transposase